MKTIKAMYVLAIVSLSAVACGDDSNDSDNKNTGGDMTAVVVDCKAVCDKKASGDCLDGATLDECKSDCDAGAQATGDCATKSAALVACGKAAADICAEGVCETEAMAAIAACLAQAN